MHTHVWHLMTEVMWTCFHQICQTNPRSIRMIFIPQDSICESRYESMCFNSNQVLHSKHSKNRMLLFLPMNELKTQQHIHETSVDTQIWPLNTFDAFRSVYSPSPKFSPYKLLVGSFSFRDPIPSICEVKELESHWHLFALSLIMFRKTSKELFLNLWGSGSVSIRFGNKQQNRLSFRGERYTVLWMWKESKHKTDQRKTSPYTQETKTLARVRDGHSSSQPPWFPGRIPWVCSISQKSVQQKVFFHICDTDYNTMLNPCNSLWFQGT